MVYKPDHRDPIAPFPPTSDKSCTDGLERQTARKSDIRYPRATADLGPAEGHAATEVIKCQARANIQREEMWPTLHYHIPVSAISPERGFSSVRRSDWPD